MATSLTAAGIPPQMQVSDLLRLDKGQNDVWRFTPPRGRSGRLYGGETAAQALVAANATVPEDRNVHSLSAAYLRAGDGAEPVTFQVHRLRDGRSFSTRQVDALQGGRSILSLTASFQVAIDSDLDYQAPGTWPATLEGSLTPEARFIDSPGRAQWVRGVMARLGVELCYAAPAGDPKGEQILMRTRGAVPVDQRLQAAAVTYLSDLMLVSAVLKPHDVAPHNPDLTFATISHSIWFHRPVRADEWVRYDISPVWTGGARGLGTGAITNHAGQLCATTAQEVLIRSGRLSRSTV